MSRRDRSGERAGARVSRLDSAIRRLQAQKAGLEWAAAAIAGQPGPVLEIGLGNGRTYDHLRDLLPDREIFVFDRQVNAHPTCVPPADRLFLGELVETMARALACLGPVAVLIHADLGSGRPDIDTTTTATLRAAAPRLLMPGGLLLSDQDLANTTARAGLEISEPAGHEIGMETQGDSDFPRFEDRGKRSNAGDSRRYTAGLVPEPLPDAVPTGRYFAYRRAT